MTRNPNRSAAAAGDACDPVADRAARLREEIEFWSGMLDAAQGSASAESIERMTFALALAEFRLRELERGPPARTGGRIRLVK